MVFVRRFILLAGLLSAGAVHADSACDGGMRPLTPNERAFFGKRDALMSALPPAPAGWETAQAPEPMLDNFEGGICRDIEASEHLTAGIGVIYHRPFSEKDSA